MELYRCDVWGFGGCVERLDRKRYTWALRPNQPSPENVPGPRSPGRSGADEGQGTTTVDSLMPQVIHPGTQGMECRVQGVIQEDRFQCPIPVVVVVGERGFRISLSSTTHSPTNRGEADRRAPPWIFLNSPIIEVAFAWVDRLEEEQSLEPRATERQLRATCARV